jgi:hypothetical protein
MKNLGYQQEHHHHQGRQTQNVQLAAMPVSRREEINEVLNRSNKLAMAK